MAKKPFNISVEFSIEAENPLEAAKKAEKMMRDKNELWQVYVQDDETNDVFSVDLSENDLDAVLRIPDYTPLISL